MRDRIPQITKRVNERWFRHEFSHNPCRTRITQEQVRLVIDEWVKDVFPEVRKLKRK